MDNMTMREFQRKFRAGVFDETSVKTQCEAGWYDWFCKDTSLAAKTQKLGKVVCQLHNSAKINVDTMYVFFKNNCPMQGGLYDDFRICDMVTGDVIYNVSNNNPHEEIRTAWTVYGKENDFEKPLFQAKNVKALIYWFDTEKEETK